MVNATTHTDGPGTFGRKDTKNYANTGVFSRAIFYDGGKIHVRGGMGRA